jgi:hypothetical protein
MTILGYRDHWPPDGCPALPVTVRLIKTIWTIHKKKRPKLVTFLSHYKRHKQVIHIKSPDEMIKVEIDL